MDVKGGKTKIEKVQIVYFSGTGGVKRVANTFEKELLERGCKVWKDSLDYINEGKDSSVSNENLEEADIVILIFAVHAVDAPDPVYEWINRTKVNNKKISVISVSGGGEVWPNTGCRNNCCKALAEKGFEIVYERMMVMPCNWVSPINDHAAMHLLRALPRKVNTIVEDLLSGRNRRTHFIKGPLRRLLSKQEKKGAHRFPKKLKISDKCTSCGWCASNCPACNIKITQNKPEFADRCIMCFRCIYGCPSKALESDFFMVLKSGFSLIQLEKRMEGVELEPFHKYTKGLIWKGVDNYLSGKDNIR